MNPKSSFISIQKSARFWTIGNENAPNLILVLHGYSQLAEYFIKNFQILSERDYFIVAPEGTHRFYLNGTSGRIGASWMTRELRENDINENNNFLEQVFQHFCKDRKYAHITLLGFSQGGSIAARFFSKTIFKIDKLILWACVFPPDLEISFELNKFSKTKKYFVLGIEDEYFTKENFEKINQYYLDNEFEVLNFEGGHRIDNSTLEKIL